MHDTLYASNKMDDLLLRNILFKIIFFFLLQLDDIDQLNIIHVAGTKGKGSTCAFTESILRQYGYKTGFFRY